MSKTLYENRWHDKVMRFNDRFPVGTSVVYTGKNGFRIQTEIRYPAVVLSDGLPVIWLRDLRDYCRLDRVVVT